MKIISTILFCTLIVPIWSQEKHPELTRLDTGVQEGAAFGWDVDISGDWAVVASCLYGVGDDRRRTEHPPVDESKARLDTIIMLSTKGESRTESTGAVQVFRRNDRNEWTTFQTILPPDNSHIEGFGHSIAIDGDKLLIGAPFEMEFEADNTMRIRLGAVYYYEFSAKENRWAFVQKIQKQKREDHDCFGVEVALSGNYALVSERAKNGKLYIMHHDAVDGWEIQKTMDRSSNLNSDICFFKERFAFSRSPQTTEKQSSDPGIFEVVISSVDPFDRSATSAILSPSHLKDGMHFGETGGVCLFDDYCFVQSYVLENEGGWADCYTGAVHVFKKEADGQWVETDVIGSPDKNPCDGFGLDIASDGERVLIGAVGDNYDKDGVLKKNLGGAYLYEIGHRSGTLHLLEEISEPIGMAMTKFGFSVAMDGDDAIIGSRLENVVLEGDTVTGAGAAYILRPTK